MAFNCILDQGYVAGCSTSGGVEKVWLGTYDPTATYTFDANNVITGVTTSESVYLMEQDIEYAGIEQPGTISRENGSVYYDTNLSLKFIELDADLRNLLVTIGRAPLFAVVKSNAGSYYYCGVESAGRATESTASLGVALTDLNGASLVINWKSPNGIYLMDEAVLGTDITIAS
jgi:hypothetical protein